MFSLFFINQCIERFSGYRSEALLDDYILWRTHIQMQIRYSNNSSEEIIVSPCSAFTAITALLHYEYSIHWHAGMHILCALEVFMSTQPSLSTLRILVRLLLPRLDASRCRCFFFYLLLWYQLARNTVDRLFHSTLITSSVLIWAFLMFNHFNKNVISSVGELQVEERKHIFCFSYVCSLFH